MENKKGFISCGKCNKKYCFLILGGSLIFIIQVFIMAIIYHFRENKEDDKNDINILSYLFFKNLGESLIIIPGLILRKKCFLKKTKTD